MITYFWNLAKKALKLLALLLLIPVFFTSCDEEALFGTTDDDFFLSEEDAIMAAQNILYPEHEPMDTSTVVLFEEDYTVSKQVNTIHPITGGTDKALFYVVNYQGGGFVLLSAEKRVNPILAYSSQNDFPLREDTYPPGLVDWLEEYADMIIEARRLEIEPSDNLSRVWSELISNTINADLINMLFCTEDEYITKKVLLDSEWGQGCGFNAELEDSCSVRCNRPPVGCVATAVAQILKYHADNDWHGNYILDNGHVAPPLDWSGMPLADVDQNNHGDIPVLMADLGPMLSMSYSCTGSGASVTNAHSTFTNNFGFETATLIDVNYSITLSDIQNNRPVYMRGRESSTEENLKGEMETTYSGHAWVADGYSRLWVCGEGYADDYKIHMNWGWGGSNYDGFFLKKDGRFDENRQIIHNIRQQSKMTVSLD